MKTFHIGGMALARRYSTLEAALAQASDDDTIEIHKNLTFSGKIHHNLIINGNGHTITVENNKVGFDCEKPIVLSNLTIVTEPRANGIILHKGGTLHQIITKIKGPARVLYPTVLVETGKLTLTDCTIMKLGADAGTQVVAERTKFVDYYGGILHLEGKENLSQLLGTVSFTYCDVDTCYFKAPATLQQCLLGTFNRSVSDVTLIGCTMQPTVRKPAVNIHREPADGPLHKQNTESRFSWEMEDGTVTATDFHSEIPQEFVGFHLLQGSLNINQTQNDDPNGYHIIRHGSISFTDTTDTAYYDITGGSENVVSVVRSTVNTSIKSKTAMDKLEELIGLEPVKKNIRSILNTITLTEQNNNKDFDFSYHMIFAGDPGTGKTTVAKIVAQALFEIGVLPENKCTEVSVDSLVKGYVGQTASHVREVLDDALGGVVFIDEAYELTAKEHSFNSEVLSVLIRYMEEHRKDLIVIAAGYEQEMKEFLASNVGLTRRFQWVSFPDYSTKEMSDIFELIRKSYGQEYETPELAQSIPQLFEKLTSLYRAKPDARGRITNGGNGGLVRNVFQQVILSKNDRRIEYPKSSKDITQADLLAGFKQEMEKAISV